MTDTDNTAPEADASDEVCSAAEALKRAKEEFEKAQACYDRVRQEAVDRIRAVRETSVGDVLDGTLNTVRKHPGPGLVVAAILGFLLGRMFRR